MKSNSLNGNFQSFLNYSLLGLILVGLFLTTRISYLLFHTFAELFSIIIAYTFFMIAWHSRQYIKNPYLLFIGTIDLLHILTYKGKVKDNKYGFQLADWTAKY